MNRLIFVKFLEDKKIVRPDLLNTIKQVYDNGMYPQTFYQTFLEPLFYDVFNVKPENRDPQIDQIEPFEGIPYLNGGLFRPELNGSDELDEREFNVRDSVLMSIIELLEQYQFSADGGPTDIDPSVLGNVFEKTINYITIDEKNKNKELGAYYTPARLPASAPKKPFVQPCWNCSRLTYRRSGDGAKQNLTTMTNYTILSTHSQRTKT